MNNERIYEKDSGFMGKYQGKTLELQAGQDKKIHCLLLLFTWVADVLSMMVERAKERHLIMPLKVGRD